MSYKKIKLSRSTILKVAPIVLFVAIFAGIGLKELMTSHAATPGYVQYLDYKSVAASSSVINASDYIPQLGSQTVSELVPRAKMLYVIGGKTPYSTICYSVRMWNNPKSATTASSGIVHFAGIKNLATVSVPADGNYHRTCVGTGTLTNTPSYSIYNQSPVLYLMSYQIQLL